VWQALDRGETPPPLVPDDATRAWLLWRKSLAIHWRSIDTDEVWALDACGAGATFAGLWEGLCTRVGEEGAPRRAATLLKQWASDGVLGSI
jgi:hypothetical protein